jgi:hypothetical protein
MIDPTNRERNKQWERAYADALKYALYRTRNGPRAEELAAEAIAVALDPERSPWDPDSGRTPSQHAVNLVRILIKAESAKRRIRDDPVRAYTVDEEMRRTVPRPDARIGEQERDRKGESRRRAVRESLNPFAQQVLDLFGEDLTPAEQAHRLGVNVSKIYEARRAIAERIRALPDEGFDGSDDTRDADLRDGDDEGGASAKETGEDEVGP